MKSEAALRKPSRGFGFGEIELASESIRRNRPLPSQIALFCTRFMRMVVSWILGCCVDVLRTLDSVKNALLAQRLALSRRQRLVAGTEERCSAGRFLAVDAERPANAMFAPSSLVSYADHELHGKSLAQLMHSPTKSAV